MADDHAVIVHSVEQMRREASVPPPPGEAPILPSVP